MKTKDIIAPLLKWWWLILIITLVGGVSSYYITKKQPPVYRATTTLVVGRALNDLNPTNNELGLSQQLADVYVTLAQRDPVMNATKQALGLKKLPDYVVSANSNNGLIDIAVVDTSPARAQAVANELARQLIMQSPTNSVQDQNGQQKFVNQQLSDLQANIAKTQQNINDIQKQLQSMNSAVEIADAQAQINALQSKMGLMQTNYATLYASTQGGALNVLTVIEPASLPVLPVGPNTLMITLLVTVIGFVLSSGTAYLLEFVDRTIKTPEDVARVLGASVIGYINEMESGKEEWSYVYNNPRSPIAEAFRFLRTNIEFVSIDTPLKKILVTSADVSDGKTTVATNLAFSIAQEERKVILLDADLRKPSVHELVGLPISPGLSEIFREKVNMVDTIRSSADKRVALITSGSPPPNPAELLGSKRMDRVLTSLEEVADYIIIDGPPFLITDAAILASKVDGVLLVIRPGQLREDQARAMLEQMQRSGTKIIGVVFNRILRGQTKSFRYYAPVYGSNKYYNDPAEESPSENGKKAPAFKLRNTHLDRNVIEKKV
jgi:capsular exopolysaccharide synthesis family protein